MEKLLLCCCAALFAANASAQPAYEPSPENLAARQRFADGRFGIFLHWGLYALLGQGEWVMTNQDIDYREYEKLAGAFCPAAFDAKAWVTAFREAGARYVCFTTRHHDGFSMFRTAQTPYNIVDATPFARDAVKELADACHRRGLRVHFYYSLIDWWSEDAPRGRTGRGTGRPAEKEDAEAYFGFMKAQLTELLTQYGPVGAIWFDGVWDQDENPGFDWRLDELYELIHTLQPACLVVNNHHLTPFEGEDVQTFERDLPGENTAGLSGQAVSRLPLETCQTMNGSWGYRITDRSYKPTDELVRYLAGAAGERRDDLRHAGRARDAARMGRHDPPGRQDLHPRARLARRGAVRAHPRRTGARSESLRRRPQAGVPAGRGGRDAPSGRTSGRTGSHRRTDDGEIGREPARTAERSAVQAGQGRTRPDKA